MKQNFEINISLHLQVPIISHVKYITGCRCFIYVEAMMVKLLFSSKVLDSISKPVDKIVLLIDTLLFHGKLTFKDAR